MAISSPRHLVYIYSETFGDVSDNYWVELPTPSDYSGISTTLVDSGRNNDGQVIAQVLRSDIAKIELKWNFLTTEQYSAIAKLFEQNLGGSFIVPVSFFNVITGLFEGDVSIAPNSSVRLFYPNDRKVEFARMVLNNDGTPQGYQNVSLHLIDTGLKYGEQL